MVHDAAFVDPDLRWGLLQGELGQAVFTITDTLFGRWMSETHMLLRLRLVCLRASVQLGSFFLAKDLLAAACRGVKHGIKITTGGEGWRTVGESMGLEETQ